MTTSVLSPARPFASALASFTPRRRFLGVTRAWPLALTFGTLGALTFATSARANDKADCTAAQKAAVTDKAAGLLTKAISDLTTCTRPVCPKALQKQCTDLTATIVASIPTVIFSAKDASGNAATAVTVTVDGTVVATNLDGSPIPLDPGSHAMKFEMEHATTVEKAIVVAPELKGQTIAIDLDANPPAPAAPAPIVITKAPDDPGSITDVSEDPTKRYYFVGLRYRGDVIPQFMLNLFVNGGKTLYSNSIGVEVDLRHDNFSLIPAISYTEFGTGNIVFEQKNKPESDPGNWSVVNSSLKGIYASADLLWSVHLANHWDFEYGAEFGLGAIFGSLQDNWVFPSPNSKANVSPTNYAECATITSGNGCSPSNHNNSQVNKVGGYEEPSWVNGGSKPNLFPLINFPQIGVRYKPMKELEARFGGGFSITGFWFGLSADYGLEKPTK